ncbi:putative ABC transporter, partial [Jimgerdemannia flammicorona]
MGGTGGLGTRDFRGPHDARDDAQDGRHGSHELTHLVRLELPPLLNKLHSFSHMSAARSRRRSVPVRVGLLFLLLSAVFARGELTPDDRAWLRDEVPTLPHPFHRRDDVPVTALTYPFANSPVYGSGAPEDKDCPPCFNCMLPTFQCTHFANCSEYNGKCHCPAGFGGDDCSKPLCGALPDGRDRKPRQGTQCDCPEGWEGINCNVPLQYNFKVCTMDNVCDPLVVTGQNGTCYRGGVTVFENHQMCNVTNRKIIDTLAGQIPQVTFSCSKKESTCDFQCGLDRPGRVVLLPPQYLQIRARYSVGPYVVALRCTVSCLRTRIYLIVELFPDHTEILYDRNITKYTCPTIDCKCIPGEMLCGKDGSIDISDLLTDEIKGPASFRCDGHNCAFSEPAMDDLILNVFGDDSIFLSCNAGECLHYTMIPGFEVCVRSGENDQWDRPLCATVGGVDLRSCLTYQLLTSSQRPERPTNWLMIIIGLSTVSIFLTTTSVGVWYLARERKTGQGYIQIADDEAGKLMADHIPATLMFDQIVYTVGDKTILSNVQGVVRPGQVMAIMGASGAGKTSLLDILARRMKKGEVKGDVLVNGRVVGDEEFKRVVGYVDQEDTMIPTLTVYETILYSALLRLPKSMSLEAKKYRVMETMHELGILAIKDSRIGQPGSRSISGGEKRRVSIACELVTSPSILFLDEPTSGLDAYNAYNVVECLVTLARSYNRTVVFTIHQPRSNIVALFDELVLLAKGYVVYSGEAARCQTYFEGIGHPCPPGFNIADYLVDLTMHAIRPKDYAAEFAIEDEANELVHAEAGESINPEPSGESTGLDDGTRPRPSPIRRGRSLRQIQDEQLFTPHLPQGEENGNVEEGAAGGEMSAHLRMLVERYAMSVVAVGVKDEIERAVTSPIPAEDDTLADGATNGSPGPFGSIFSLASTKIVSSHERPSWYTQFAILSDRTFKNLYRSPMLMLTHYATSVFLALLCGALFYKVENTIAGFQNRMGVFFFIEALFAFSCLTSLQVFAVERILFVRERANGYYKPITYFLAKVVFDIIPLRVVPPLMMGVIIYHMIGLVDGTTEFLKFLLVLVLFNLTAAAVCLCAGVVFRDHSVAMFLCTLVMLFSMLFAGLLLNKGEYSFAFWLGALRMVAWPCELALMLP